LGLTILLELSVGILLLLLFGVGATVVVAGTLLGCCMPFFLGCFSVATKLAARNRLQKLREKNMDVAGKPDNISKRMPIDLA